MTSGKAAARPDSEWGGGKTDSEMDDEKLASGDVDKSEQKGQFGSKAIEISKQRTPSSAIQDFDKNLPEVSTEIQGNKMIIQFPQVSFFNSAQFTLTDDGDKALRRFANVFKSVNGRLRLVVRGYTDNRPVRAGNPYKDNLELSALRAISALRSLNANGIPFHLMRIGGYGESDKSKEITEKELQKYDRKVVLVVEPLDQTERGFDDYDRNPASKNENKNSNVDTKKETI
ncbi:MAG: OmpA family protein [Bdellovibrionales bacterium]